MGIMCKMMKNFRRVKETLKNNQIEILEQKNQNYIFGILFILVSFSMPLCQIELFMHSWVLIIFKKVNIFKFINSDFLL